MDLLKMNIRITIYHILEHIKCLFTPHRYEIISSIINKNNYNTFVEVGVYRGDTSRYVLSHCKKLKTVYAIDNYGNSEDKYYDKKDYDYSKKLAYSKLHKDKRVKFIYTGSKEASRKFKDNSLDIVFIDAHHTYKDLKEDIKVWYPKIKQGGILCGHDYSLRFIGVVNAVNDSFGTYSVASDDVWIVKKHEILNTAVKY